MKFLAPLNRAWLAALTLCATPGFAGEVLEAQFVPAPVAIDGVVDEVWSRAAAAPLSHAYDSTLNSPAANCAVTGELRALWDGAALYLLISVRDGLVSNAAGKITDRDGVEFWVDHFNDKTAKFQEDDGTFTITAPPAAFLANRAQNPVFDNVSSRYLKSFASALQTDASGATTGYNVEIAWYLGEHARANGSKFGFDVGINKADASNTRQCRVFWNTASKRSTDSNVEWGTVVLAGYDGHARLHLDTFMLGANIAKANALVRGIWRDERALNKALAAARTAMTANSQHDIDSADRALDSALRGLRRKGPYPDPYDLPTINHLNDPFQFFDGRRVKTVADWNRRRDEIKSLMQYYEFGVQPKKPATLAASSVTNGQVRDISVSMSDEGRSATFAPRLTLPSAEQARASGRSAPFPVIVSLDFRVADANAVYLDAGYAVLSIPYSSVQSDNVAHTGAVFDLYPYDVTTGRDIGSLAGWAWGASRAVDALEFLTARDANYRIEVNGVATPLLDLNKLAVVGFSRLGKAALLTGMLDERFKVTHAGGSGSGGAAPYRFMPFRHEYTWGRTDGSEVLGDHLRHQTHNSNEMMRRFLNDSIPATVQGRMYQTKTHGYGERLPFDHHLEIAAIAPRAVFIANTNDDYGNNPEGDSIGFEAAKPVFDFLGASNNLALDIYLGGGGHSLKVPQQHNFVRFLDYVLYGVPLPDSAPPGDATRTPTQVQLRRDPYLTGAGGGRNVYDIYYGGFASMMPWLTRAPQMTTAK